MRLDRAIDTSIPPELRQVLTRIVDKAQDVGVNIMRTAPGQADLKQGEMTLYYDGTNLWIYTKYQGALYRMQWTAV